MSLKAVNLNLLPVLRALLRLRSVSAAGRSLGRSPPAISEGLAQLRLTFADPLLVRIGGRMELTPRALELVDPVEEICSKLDILFEAGDFDPAKAERVFTIAAHDFHVLALGPDMVSQLELEAPGVTIRFVDLGHDLAERLASRAVDLALMPEFHLGDIAPVGLLHAPLATDSTVVVMRKGHPLAEFETADRESLARYEHVAFHPTWEPVNYRKAIGAFHRQFPVRVRVSQISLLPFFLGQSDRVALGPAGLDTLLGPHLGLVSRPVAGNELDIRSIVAWSALQDSDSAHRWFRHRLMTYCEQRRFN